MVPPAGAPSGLAVENARVPAVGRLLLAWEGLGDERERSMQRRPRNMSASATFFALVWFFCGLLMISGTGAVARDWLVPEQAPTIQAAIDSCVTGDVVVISPGTYTDCTNYSENVYHIAVLTPGVSLRGATGDPADVILDAGYAGRCLEIRNCSATATIEGITFRRGQAVSPFGKGGAVFSIFSNPEFRSCVFDSNRADFGGAGISASYGSLVVEDCLFSHNECPDGIGAAVQVSRAPTTISGCTIYGSQGSAVHYATDGLTMERTIIAAGSAASLGRNQSSDPDPEISCCDFFDNEEDWPDFISGQLGSDGNISADPYFCNAMFDDFHLYMVSPCAEENAGSCGRIGLYPAACGFGASTYVVQPDGTGDYPTIQAALNAAAASDTIALASGTFTGEGNRDLDFLGKDVTVMSLVGDAAAVTIDCQGTVAENHRAFVFERGETNNSILRDVTITGAEFTGDGGAVLCRNSSPRIENVVFHRNGATRGAGIFVDHGDPIIRGCTFTENRGDANAGGVAAFGSVAEIRDCLFTGNWGYLGSAVFLPDSSTVDLVGCTISGNNSSLDKDAVGVDGTATLNISNCLITFNSRHAVRDYGTGTITISGSNVYGNAEGNYEGDIAGSGGSGGNLSVDPLYCDAESWDFSLRGDSPCTAGNAPNLEQMGAFGVGCAAPSIFSDVSGSIAATSDVSAGVSLVDLNGDGHLDFLVGNDETANQVMLGDGAGGFAPWLDVPILLLDASATRTSAWGDHDNDGDLDCYLSNDDLMNLLLRNDGDSYNVVQGQDLDVWEESGRSAWCDYDGDGNLDLFIAARDTSSVLMRGDGAGGFSRVDSEAINELTEVTAAAWGDYDNDGDPDLYVVRAAGGNILLENDSGFTDVTESPLDVDGACRSAAWGDYDNDGDLDLYVTRDGAANQLLRNDGNGNFSDRTRGPLGDDGPGRSGLWGDWDNDGDLDLFLTNCGAPDALLRNDGGGNFTNTVDAVTAAADSSAGAAFGDWDEDGDLDLVIADRGGTTRLRRNDQDGGRHWLGLNLSNVDGGVGSVGARVEVTTLLDGEEKVQIREVGASAGWLSQDPLLVHVGLDTATVVSKLRVTWPGGLSWVDSNLAVNQVLSWTQPDSADLVSPVADVPLARLALGPARPNPFNPSTTISFTLPEEQTVRLDVYDVRGRRVRRLLNGHLPAGERQVVWDGCDDADRPVAAGVYLVRLRAGSEARTRGVTLLK